LFESPCGGQILNGGTKVKEIHVEIMQAGRKEKE
jgi:hypothetical protein